ncbi:ankyrin repeat domain-containing protein [Scytonema sp. NUACC21]
MNSLSGQMEPEPNVISIYETIVAGDISKVREFIDSGIDVNCLDSESGWTPLEIAANEGNLEAIEILLEAGASVHKGASTPLHLAASNGFTQVVNLLLETGKYAEKKKNQKFYNAFLTAICGGYLEIVRSLLAAGANVNQVWDCGSSLHYAIQQGHKAIVELLLTAGASVDIRDPDEYGYQFTPLMETATEVRDETGEIAKMLIAAGADINAKDINGRTPLILAAEFCNAEVAAILIQAGADINAKDNDGNTALMYASRNEVLETENYLETFGSSLDNLKIMRRISIAKMLIDAGASTEGLMAIALVKAAEQGSLSKVLDFIETGVNINAKNSYGQTALIQAVEQNHIDIVATLIKAGADVNLGETDGTTPLMRAAEKGHIGIARMLIHAGSHVNAHNKYGHTALFYAQQDNFSAIVQLLRKSGAKQYHNTPILQRLGIDSSNLNDRYVLVQAPIDDVSRALSQIRNATIWCRDVFEREVILTDVCFVVFRFFGHHWTLIHEENMTLSYHIGNGKQEILEEQLQDMLKVEDAQALSKLLQTKAIYYGCNCTTNNSRYELFDKGECLEEFYYSCNENFADEKLVSSDECLIAHKHFRFRSKLRYLSLGEIVKHQSTEDEDFDKESSVSIDSFKFVDDFFKSQNAYIPAWGSHGWGNNAGRRVTLSVIGLDPEDVERMDFIAVK